MLYVLYCTCKNYQFCLQCEMVYNYLNLWRNIFLPVWAGRWFFKIHLGEGISKHKREEVSGLDHGEPWAQVLRVLSQLIKSQRALSPSPGSKFHLETVEQTMYSNIFQLITHFLLFTVTLCHHGPSLHYHKTSRVITMPLSPLTSSQVPPSSSWCFLLQNSNSECKCYIFPDSLRIW